MDRYDASWDRPHHPGPQPEWQESDWLTFFDPRMRVGGTYRIGREPNRKKGQPNLFVYALGGQRFLMKELGGRGADLSVGDEDAWPEGYRVAGHQVDALGNGSMRYQWDYPESSGDLQFSESHYEPRDWSKSNKGREIIAWLNPDGHLECAGNLRGTIRIGERDYRVDCFAHRDRSWGYREAYMGKMRRAFGAWGTIGPAFSFATMRLELKDGPTLTTGFVSRNGETDDIADVRWLTTLDTDLCTPVSGRLVVTLENDEELIVECGIAQTHRVTDKVISFSSTGPLHYDGHLGFCHYSATGDARDTENLERVAHAPGLTRSAN